MDLYSNFETLISPKSLITICVPVYNEEENIRPFHNRLCMVLSKLSTKYNFEILFTDNHSEDSTFEEIIKLKELDSRIRAIRFSRNFGFQASILTGYIQARGVAAIQIDCDLQDPPELIIDFIQHWENGYKVVYGVRSSRPESFWITSCRKFFYRLIDYLSESRLPHDAGDFRLIDKVIIDQLRNLKDQQPYLRGLIAGMGFKQIGIPYNRDARAKGKSKFNFRSLFYLALDGMLHHSVIPLRLVIVFGMIMATISFFSILYLIFEKTIGLPNWPRGFASSTVLHLLAIGINSILLGIIGEYIARIYRNIKSLPITIIESVIDSPISMNNQPMVNSKEIFPNKQLNKIEEVAL